MSFSNFTHTLLPAYISTNNTLTQFQNQTAALSPVSMLLSLLLVWLGAEGQTASQMQRAMYGWEFAPVPMPPAGTETSDTTLNVTTADTNATEVPRYHPPAPPPHGDLLPIDRDQFMASFQTLVDSAYSQQHFTMHHALYLDEAHELNPKFLQKMREIFKANRPSVNLVDFKKTDAESLDKLVQRMNQDVEKNTNGIVSDMVSVRDFTNSPVKKNGVIILDAAFFADAWKLPFNSLLSMRGSPFYLMQEESEEERRRRRAAAPMGNTGGTETPAATPETHPEVVHVDMMTLRGDIARFRYAENVLGLVGTQSVQLQYKNNASLVLLLPATNERRHITQVLRRMVYRGPADDQPFISQLVAAHKLTELRFVQVPRNLIECSGGGWIETLRRMGMNFIFDAKEAELNALVSNAAVSAVGDQTLHVSHLLHKVIIPLVDERTDDLELDADIAAENEAFGGAPSGGFIRLTFNRPFFAFLVGQNGDLLGASLVMNPAK